MHSRLQFFPNTFQALADELKALHKDFETKPSVVFETSLKPLATSGAKVVILVLTVLTRQPLTLRTLGKMFLLLMESFL